MTLIYLQKNEFSLFPRLKFNKLPNQSSRGASNRMEGQMMINILRGKYKMYAFRYLYIHLKEYAIYM